MNFQVVSWEIKGKSKGVGSYGINYYQEAEWQKNIWEIIHDMCSHFPWHVESIGSDLTSDIKLYVVVVGLL